jgi:16S rRNA (guanine966-N2)-methyltransferase
VERQAGGAGPGPGFPSDGSVSLRIIAGEFRGRRIRAPEGRVARPTRDEVREAWFNALGDRVRGSRVLDLFSGSGALGLEALSRGAAYVCFVESNRAVRRVLEGNIELLGVSERSALVSGDALTVAEGLPRTGAHIWDIVLADPPYASDAADRLVAAFKRGAFADILCVEHAPGLDFGCEPDWQRRYGETAVSMFLDPTEGADDD